MISVLHIDEDPAWRVVVQGLLTNAGIERVESVENGEEGRFRAATSSPAVVVTELSLRNEDAFALVRDLCSTAYPPRVVALTMRSDDVTLHGVRTSRLSGFLWKTPRALQCLAQAVRSAHSGVGFFPQEFRDASARLSASPDAFFKVLTSTEHRLLGPLGNGMSDVEIAAQASVSTATIRWHRQNIMRKLSLPSDRALIRWASEKGFVRPLLPAPPCVVVE